MKTVPELAGSHLKNAIEIDVTLGDKTLDLSPKVVGGRTQDFQEQVLRPEYREACSIAVGASMVQGERTW